ncbi:CrcB protein [Natronospira proteinivora]|uniref:Fluoride-specific ion channel FluC n=1 Tax=Natronospira proteinivora TaxID=1807133 RepID=A0ABT1G5E6_9GAMM|nr:CrcB family protein [Natronospira proteinivora]MCP1726527.1 CrcB protein [Natronospira proteinivora]
MGFWLSIALGGALGAISRYWLGHWFNHFLGRRLPWGTLSVNVLGAGLLGFFAAWLLGHPGETLLIHSESPLWAGLGVGFCGSLTTISSWSLESLRLALDRRAGALFTYIALTLILCLMAVTVGFMLGGQLVPD